MCVRCLDTSAWHFLRYCCAFILVIVVFCIRLNGQLYCGMHDNPQICFFLSPYDFGFVLDPNTWQAISFCRFTKKQGLDQTFYECETHMWRLGKRELPDGIFIDGGSDWIIITRHYANYLTTSSDPVVLGVKHLFRFTLLPAEVSWDPTWLLCFLNNFLPLL